MSLEGVNRQLASVWAAWSAQWVEDFPAAVGQWSLAPGTPGSLHFQDSPAQPLTASLSVGTPPAYRSLAKQRLTLDAPAPGGAPWGLHVSGHLDGALLAVRVLNSQVRLLPIHSKFVDISVGNLRFSGDVSMDASDPALPLLQPPVALTGGLDVDITGSIVLSGRMAIVPAPAGLLPGLRLTADADLSDFFDSPGLHVRVDLLLTLAPKPVLTVTALIPLAGESVRVKFGVPVHALDKFGLLPGALVNASFPRVWPVGGPQPTPVSAPAPSPALDMYRVNARKIEAGHEAHLPFLGSPGNLRRFSAVLDNLYPPVPLGTLIPPPDPSAPPKPLGTKSAGDCAIWTGHALAAEAFRYGDARKRGDAAQTAEALRRAQDILAYLGLLFEIPRLATAAAGDEQRGLLCRCVLPEALMVQNDDFDLAHKPQEYYRGVAVPPDPAHGWERDNPYVGKARDTDAPTRDSLTGVALGLTLAHQLIDDAGVRAQASAMLTDLLGYLLRHSWNYPTPAGTALSLGADGRLKTRTVTSFFHNFLHQLAFLRAGALVNPAAFAGPYQALASDLADAAWLPAWGDALEPVAGYFKFNLDHGCLLLLLLPPDGAPPGGGQEGTFRASYLEALALLQRTVGHHRNAYFQLVGVLADPLYAQTACAGTVSATGTAMTVAEEIRALLDEWAERCNDVAGPNWLPRKAVPVTAQQELEARFATQPGAFQDYRDFLVLDDEGLLALQALPLRQRDGGGWDFGWQRGPFQSGLRVAAGTSSFDVASENVEAAGVDYLLACWMAAYLGVV